MWGGFFHNLQVSFVLFATGNIVLDVTNLEQGVFLLGQSRNLELFIYYNNPPLPRTFYWVFGKMGCLGNSKTEDQRNEEKAQREANKKIEKQLQKDKQIYRATHRLLLLGRFLEMLSNWCLKCLVLYDVPLVTF